METIFTTTVLHFAMDIEMLMVFVFLVWYLSINNSSASLTIAEHSAAVLEVNFNVECLLVEQK